MKMVKNSLTEMRYLTMSAMMDAGARFLVEMPGSCDGASGRFVNTGC